MSLQESAPDVRKELALRPYQREAIDFLVNKRRGRGIIGHEMRVGKTCIALNTVKELCQDADALDSMHILVVTRMSAVPGWFDECRRWGFPEPSLYRGQNRKITKFMLCSYAMIGREVLQPSKAFPWEWDVIIYDEFQWMCNRKKSFFKAAKRLKSSYVLLLSGQKFRPQQLWAPLHIINPKAFSSYWRFINTFCFVIDTTFGKTIEGVRNRKQLNELLHLYMVRKTFAQVSNQIPSQRLPLFVELTSKQRRHYQELDGTKLTVADDGRIVVAPNSLAQAMKLRQVLVTPNLLGVEDVGGGLTVICDRMEDSQEPHIVIFTPFANAIPYIQSYLDARGFDSIALHGQMPVDKVRENLEKFEREKCAAVCTIKYSQGFSLASSDIAYFLGAEWGPAENLQAEARLNAVGKTVPNTIFYLKHLNTVEDRVFDILDLQDKLAKDTYGGFDES